MVGYNSYHGTYNPIMQRHQCQNNLFHKTGCCIGVTWCLPGWQIYQQTGCLWSLLIGKQSNFSLIGSYPPYLIQISCQQLHFNSPEYVQPQQRYCAIIANAGFFVSMLVLGQLWNIVILTLKQHQYYQKTHKYKYLLTNQ